MGAQDDPTGVFIIPLEFGVKIGELPFSRRRLRPKRITANIRTHGTRGIKNPVRGNSSTDCTGITRRAVLNKITSLLKGEMCVLSRKLKCRR